MSYGVSKVSYWCGLLRIRAEVAAEEAEDWSGPALEKSLVVVLSHSPASFSLPEMTLALNIFLLNLSRRVLKNHVLACTF